MKKSLIILLIIFTAIILCAALSGCAAPDLEDVFEKVGKMKYIEINMNFISNSFFSREQLTNMYIYGEERKDGQFFAHAKRTLEEWSEEAYYKDNLIYQYTNGEYVGVSRLTSEDQYDTYDIGYTDFMMLEFGDLNYSVTQEELPEGRTAYDFDFSKDLIDHLFGALVGESLTCKIRLTVKNSTRLPESMFFEFKIDENNKITCETEYKFKKNKNEKMPEQLESIIPEEDGLEYYLYDGVNYYIVDYTGLYDTVNVPSEHNGLPVVGILCGAFEDCRTVRHVNLSDTVTLIQSNAFSGSNIEQINLSKNLTLLEENAFSGTFAEIVFPEDSVIENIGEYTFAYYQGSFIVLPDSVKVIAENAFRESSLEIVTLPEGLLSVGDCAFNGCEELKSVMIPDEVNYLGYEAFAGCISLEKVTLPAETLTELKSGTFYECGLLREINSDSGEIVLPDCITELGREIFLKCTSIISIEFPSALSSIPDYCCSDCNSLDNVIIPEGVSIIGSRAFLSCRNLRTVTLPSTLIEINSGAFEGSGLIAVNFEGSALVKLGMFAFAFCTKLISIDLPQGLTHIGQSAFDFCSSLKRIGIPQSVEVISSEAFGSCTNLTGIQVDADNAAYKSAEGVLYNKAGTELIVYPAGRTAANFAVPQNVVRIKENAFLGADDLKNLILPSSIEVIGIYAFHHTLETITLYSEEPPFCNGFSFDRLYVPLQSVETYKTEYSWCADRIYPITE